MKKLFMKQKLLSTVDSFTVKDETETDCYTVKGDYITVGGKKLHISDMTERELATVKQKLLSLMPKFYVYVDGQQVAEIVKKISLFKAKYLVNGPGWEVRGSLLDHDYTITKDSEEIVRVHKVWFSWGDSYEIDIYDEKQEVLALAVVLAIDLVLEQQAANRNASD